MAIDTSMSSMNTKLPRTKLPRTKLPPKFKRFTFGVHQFSRTPFTLRSLFHFKVLLAIDAGEVTARFAVFGFGVGVTLLHSEFSTTCMIVGETPLKDVYGVVAMNREHAPAGAGLR